MLGAALGALIGTQAVVVAATLAVPVLAPGIAADLGIAPALLGYHTATVFAFAFVFAQGSAAAVRRAGPIGISMATVGLAALALAAIGLGGVAGLAVSAPLLGAAYAQGNTASGALLSRLVTDRNRNIVFSIKQTSVPIGAAAAGLLLPAVTLRLDWMAAVLALFGAALVTAALCAPVRRRLDDLMAGTDPVGGKTRPFRVLRSSAPVRRMAALAGCFAAVQFGLSAMFVTLLVERHGLGLAEAGGALTVAMCAEPLRVFRRLQIEEGLEPWKETTERTAIHLRHEQGPCGWCSIIKAATRASWRRSRRLRRRSAVAVIRCGVGFSRKKPTQPALRDGVTSGGAGQDQGTGTRSAGASAGQRDPEEGGEEQCNPTPDAGGSGSPSS
jgi:hypothetical protein